MQTEHPHARLALLDLTRALAVVFMIQGHSLDVLLNPLYRQGALFNTWLFLRGLTAPTFFTLSGMSFTVATLRRWDSYVQFSPALFRRFRKYAFFILLGYLVHLPVRSLRDFQHLDAAGWQGWFQIDVLQCVGLTLIALQLLVWAAKTPQRFARLSLWLCASVVLLTPIIWTLNETRHLPLILAAHLSTQTGSIFPLFPWSGYIFLGSAAGFAYTQWWAEKKLAPVWVLATGALVALGGLAMSRLPLFLVGHSNFWKNSPNLFLIRAGCVCCLFSILALASRGFRISNPVVNALARESLIVYLIHACILYGSIWNTGLRQTVGANLAPVQCLEWISVLILSMITLAWSWNWYKRNESKGIRAARLAMFLLAVLYSVA